MHDEWRTHGEAITAALNEKYPNRVVPQLGLCIALYDVVAVGEAQIHPGSAAHHTHVEFRLVVFRPFVGEVLEGSPAANAALIGEGGDDRVGLKPGDTIVAIDGHHPNRFDSIALKVAMAEKGASLPVTVDRGGELLTYSVTPEKGGRSGLLEIGVTPRQSNRIATPATDADRAAFDAMLARVGLGDILPGDVITSIDGEPTPSFFEIRTAFEHSGGAPLTLEIDRDGETLSMIADPLASLQLATAEIAEGEPIGYEHLLGMLPVLAVAEFGDAKQGLMHGDIFRRVGSLEFPGEAAGIAEIRASANRKIPLGVLRDDGAGAVEVVELEATVTGDGRVGFTPTSTARMNTLLARSPETIVPLEEEASPVESPAAVWADRAGIRVRTINGEAVADFPAMRRVIGSPSSAAASERCRTDLRGSGGQGGTGREMLEGGRHNALVHLTCLAVSRAIYVGEMCKCRVHLT